MKGVLRGGKKKGKVHKPKLPVLSREDFVAEMNKRAIDYQNDVISGKKLTGKFIKLQCERNIAATKDEKFYFNQEATDIAFRFFSMLRIPIGGNPEQFKLTDYQAWIIYHLFGWYVVKNKRRRYRYAMLFTARKSGKTMFSVAVMLLLSYYDNAFDSEVYLLATTKEQAGQGLKYLKGIVMNSPMLLKRSKVRRFDVVHSENGEALIKSLAAKPESLDGLNPNAAIIDEMHAHPDLSLYNIIKSGVMSRDNPMILITSTAGFDKDYPFYDMVERGKRVLLGENTNDSMFYAFFLLDDDDDPEDQSMWVKANPNLGQSIPEDALAIEWEQAKDSIIEKNNFLVKNLNIYMDGVDQWIEDSDYVKCFKEKDILKMKGWKAWAGLDLAATRDLASLVWILQDPKTEKFIVVPEFYFPQSPKRKVRKTGVDIGQWIEKGFVREHETKTIDYDDVYERIQYFDTIFDIQMLGYDKWNSSTLVQKVELELGIYCEGVPQTTAFFNFPLKYLERQILSENILLSKNPVLRWNFRNIVMWQDGNGNVKIAKNKSNDSVDGAVSLAMAMGCWIKDNFNMEDFILTQHNQAVAEGKEKEES